MKSLTALVQRLLKARFLVLLLAFAPVAVFSLVLNDSREFIIPVENSARAFAAAAGPRAAVQDVPLIGGLFIEPEIAAEPARLAAGAEPGPPVQFSLETPAGVRVLALAQPRGFGPQDYSPDQLINLPGGRALPGFGEVGGANGGGIGTLAQAAPPPDGGGPAGIPEPESWGLMAFGLAVIGSALRRRQKLRRQGDTLASAAG
jgi:hypothetical protein